jgi:hypothetical protein
VQQDRAHGEEGQEGFWCWQEAIDFELTGERRERNSLIDDLRREMERWRQRDYERVTPTTANYCHIALIRHAARIASATASGGRRDGDLPG